MITKTTIFLLSSLLLLAGCQSTGGSREDVSDILDQAAILDGLNMNMGGEARNVAAFTINGWNYIDNRNLVIISRPDEYYLVTFPEPCEQLRTAVNIYFEVRGPAISSSDAVVAVPMLGDGQRCRMDGIYELVPREVVGG